MSDLDTATAQLLARVDRQTPDESKRVRVVLDSLVQWSKEHAWGVKFSARGPAGSVRYCADGAAEPFWAITPRTGDGARLTLPAVGHPRLSEELREEARQTLSRIDRRVPTDDEVPSVACAKLLWEPYRDGVLALMTRVLRQVCGVTEEVNA